MAARLRPAHLLIEQFGSVRRISINNPRKKNAINLQAYSDLADELNAADEDESVTVAVLTGVGDFYSSGNDISALMSSDKTIEERLESSNSHLTRMVRAFYSFNKLLIGVLNGPAIGVAATTAVLCDVLYMADTAYIHTPFTALGLCAEGCSSYTFPKLMGRSKASEMLLLNHRMSAQEALEFNVVAELFKREDFESKLWPRILQYGKLPVGSIKATKQLMRKFESDKLEEANEREAQVLAKRWFTEEAMQAIVNFMSRKSKM
ncbi:enoyl-CoA delta isomerase 2 [Toxorhynchites rutilus septentrionalis]|uniref:enoyl-CoA delta isomerase 2 n=1 Tax=Toxorhynchites rutilus septentrionalis TaxID=329112 RepID=UPI002479997E|nr:enoyl-CoA delta isomerase 2 [Toxorhynchites rutilus septentrionalis]